MAQVRPVDVGPVHDLVGIGFGPSNLALAIAVEEHARRAARRSRRGSSSARSGSAGTAGC